MGMLIRVLLFSLALTLLFTLAAHLLPQVEGERPSEALTDWQGMTPDEFAALGEKIFTGKGTCTLCHNNLGRAPDLLASNMDATSSARLSDPHYSGKASDMETYLRESMLHPSAYVVAGFGKKGTGDTVSPMPPVDQPPAQLNPDEVNAVIAFFQTRSGQAVTVALPGTNPEPEDEPGAAPAQQVIAATSGEEVLQKYACIACHKILDSEATIGPDLTRVASRSGADEIRESIVDPGKQIAQGYPPMMPVDFADRMTAREMELLVAYLSGLPQ